MTDRLFLISIDAKILVVKNMEPIKIAIADDHALFREGLVGILNSFEEFNVTCEAGSGPELLQNIAVQLPDVILLDLKMPGMSGIEVTEQLKSQYPQIKVIILTMHHQDDFILHMLYLGVNAYLLKDTSSKELKEAIVATHERDYYFDEKVSKVMLQGLRKKHLHKPKLDSQIRLTPREEEVLELICREYTTSEMAEKLFVSQRTIESHRKNLLEKLGAKNTAGLVIRAISQGLFQPDALE